MYVYHSDLVYNMICMKSIQSQNWLLCKECDFNKDKTQLNSTLIKTFKFSKKKVCRILKNRCCIRLFSKNFFPSFGEDNQTINFFMPNKAHSTYGCLLTLYKWAATLSN